MVLLIINIKIKYLSDNIMIWNNNAKFIKNLIIKFPKFHNLKLILQKKRKVLFSISRLIFFSKILRQLCLNEMLNFIVKNGYNILKYHFISITTIYLTRKKKNKLSKVFSTFKSPSYCLFNFCSFDYKQI